MLQEAVEADTTEEADEVASTVVAEGVDMMEVEVDTEEGMALGVDTEVVEEGVTVLLHEVEVGLPDQVVHLEDTDQGQDRGRDRQSEEEVDRNTVDENDIRAPDPDLGRGQYQVGAGAGVQYQLGGGQVQQGAGAGAHQLERGVIPGVCRGASVEVGAGVGARYRRSR
jgi:hypothetical protein